MLKRTQLFLLFMLAFCAAFLVGSIPEAKADQPLTVSEIEFGEEIKATIDGGAAKSAQYKDENGIYKPMIPVDRGWITNGTPEGAVYPDTGPTNGYEVYSTTLGAATGSWIFWIGLWWWIAP
jgi:hypothetical protein